MDDLVAALGLLLAIEGIAFAAFPAAMRRAMAEVSQVPAELMRLTGILSAALGVLLVWLVRGAG